MLGWKLFLRAVNLILDNLGTALRLTALPYGLAAIASIWVATGWPEFVGQVTFDPSDPLPGDFATAKLIEFGFVVLAYLWVAVAWHRFVLLGEDGRGWVPPIHGGLMLGYLGRSLLVGIATVAIVAAIATMLSVLLLPIFGTSVGAPISAVALFVAMLSFYRLGVVLPAGAVGKRMTFGEAMRATAGHSGTAVVLALVTVAFSFLLQLPAVIDGGGGLISVIYQLVVQWIGLMFGVGTLTALYGVVVEGRPVD
ncbi:hypothetical protein ACK8OR_17595 [Jannaschia sp. KMU-145]|uniref:hypothetical protein n=1 Tax=Jannaschia halovivens TaxID=3388667 RepID=UPI00396AF2B0